MARKKNDIAEWQEGDARHPGASGSSVKADGCRNLNLTMTLFSETSFALISSQLIVRA
jgi:hypothetical protein